MVTTLCSLRKEGLCPIGTCSGQIRVHEGTEHLNAEMETVCLASCTLVTPNHFQDVRVEELAASGPANRPEPRKYDKALTKDWSQKKAAAMLGISERQLRSYKTKPPDAHWPGWQDPLALQQWMNQREDRDLMAQALSRSLPYRDTVTERKMKK